MVIVKSSANMGLSEISVHVKVTSDSWLQHELILISESIQNNMTPFEFKESMKMSITARWTGRKKYNLVCTSLVLQDA